MPRRINIHSTTDTPNLRFPGDGYFYWQQAEDAQRDSIWTTGSPSVDCRHLFAYPISDEVRPCFGNATRMVFSILQPLASEVINLTGKVRRIEGGPRWVSRESSGMQDGGIKMRSSLKEIAMIAFQLFDLLLNCY